MSKHKILYVDDEQSNLDVFEATFWRDYDLFLADSAKEGAKVLKNNDIQLVITDERMPEMSGIEFLESILDEHPDPIRMVMTGYGDISTVIDAVNKGRIYHYITKPWREEELRAVIKRAIESYALKKENRLLVDKLQKTNNRLEVYTQSLEEKVKERTAEIKEKNVKLNGANEELKKTLKQLKVVQDQLVESAKMTSLALLSAGIAHEINNPINVVYAGVSILKRNIANLVKVTDRYHELSDDANIKEALKEIHMLKEDVYYEEIRKDIFRTIEDVNQGADRTAKIVKSLSNLSKYTDEESKVTYLHGALDACLAKMAKQIPEDVKIEKCYDEKVIFIDCYPKLLSQAFVNIITNGLQTIEEKREKIGKGFEGVIKIETRNLENSVRISINDNGEGIPEGIKSRLFEPFFTTKNEGKGKGLGLAASYGIMEKHNATLEVHSDAGEGSTFILIFPKKPIVNIE
ncbi:MAG: ATP-binding protein [Bacteroidota bacterium]